MDTAVALRVVDGPGTGGVVGSPSLREVKTRSVRCRSKTYKS